MASDLTPLRKRPYPAETDTPDVAADVQALAISLDNCPNVHQGTLAARPSTGMVAGDRYYVIGDSTLTNNGIEWLYDGSQWTQITYESPIGAGDLWFGPNDPADTRWLICDGRAISRTTYATLFSIVGTSYGVGNGTSTFNIPDLRQRVPLGKKATGWNGSSANLGETGGQIDHQHTVPGLTIPGLSIPSLSCSVSVPNHSHPLSGNGGAAFVQGQFSSQLVLWSDPSGPNHSYSGGWLYSYASPSSGFITAFAGAQPSAALVGSTDGSGSIGASGSTSSGTTGGASTGGSNSGQNNPPFLTVNFIIRVS